MATDYSDDQRPSPTDEVREYDVPAKRTFVLTITTDYPDGEQATRDAAHKAVEQIGWGDDNTSSFELVERHDDGTETYLAGWEFEPGEQSDLPGHNALIVDGTLWIRDLDDSEIRAKDLSPEELADHLDDLLTNSPVGRTVAGQVTDLRVPGAHGDEPCVITVYDDGTVSYTVMPTDD